MIASSKERFEKWLKKEGYKDWSDAGNPSTIAHYIYWVNRIKNEEGIKDWSDLPDHMMYLLNLYGENGAKKEYGENGNCAVINALRRYSEFLLNDCDWVPETKTFLIHSKF